MIFIFLVLTAVFAIDFDLQRRQIFEQVAHLFPDEEAFWNVA